VSGTEIELLDATVIAELREATGNDEAFLLDLIGTFVDEADGHLEGMADAAANGDASAMVRPAHTLKSSSASIGAMRLSAICRTIEAACREGRLDGLQESVEHARLTWVATREVLRGAGLTP
jgi:HPt (histidine-containing phosphotransfer) domain-containing protein